jgi:hypothetical protein
MALAVARSFLAQRGVQGVAVQFQSIRALAMEGVKGFSEAEKGIEDLYFTKEDQVPMLRSCSSHSNSQLVCLTGCCMYWTSVCLMACVEMIHSVYNADLDPPGTFVA